MRRFMALVGALVVGLTAVVASTAAGPTAGGFTSDDVAYVDYVPFEIGSATGVNIIGDLMYVTSWKNMSIYDISDHRSPQLLSITPIGFEFENEDVTGNEELLFISESLPNDILHIWDVRDPSAPVEIKQVQGAGNHTSQCILNCEYVLGSDGDITHVGQTVENAMNAELLDENWHQLVDGIPGGVHDVEIIKEGFILTTPISQDFHVIDVRDPLNPVVLGRGKHPAPADWLFHSGAWFNQGTDRFLIMQGEQNFQPRCGEGNGPIVLYEVTNSPFDPATGEPNGTEFEAEIRDTYSVENGTYQDGSPAVNALGCSAHWFQASPDFHDGGLVASGYYEHGTRFLQVTDDGRLLEAGWFLPYGGSTSAAYWVDRRTIYAVDYVRGIDILEWTGDIPGVEDEEA